jgi:hypothetical protein
MAKLNQRITHSELEAFKRDVLEKSVLVAPAEAARILSCSERKVYDLVRGGDLHGYNKKRGTAGLRLLARELQDYVQSIKIDKNAWLE